MYSPAITDFTIMVKNTSYMFVTGPDVIKMVTHEDVTKDELGGAMTHNATSGVAHFAAESDRDCLALIRDLLSFMPSNNLDDPPRARSADPPDREEASLDRLVPPSPNQPYDMLELIHTVADEGYFLEVHQHYARNIIVGFARLDGRPVGVVANQPAVLAGTLDIDASVKWRALRAVLRRIQHSTRDTRGRARVPARYRAGVRRHHQARREAALRVR